MTSLADGDAVELSIDGMTCASCANRIEHKLNKLDGVTATVNCAREKAKLIFPGSVDLRLLGYVAVPDEAKEGIVATSARSHALALREDGRVITWGPDLPANLTVPAEAQSGVTAISAGAGFSLALKTVP